LAISYDPQPLHTLRIVPVMMENLQLAGSRQCQPMRKLVLVFPADRRVSPAAKFVGDAFIEIAADLVNRKIWAGHLL
jgi:hypothetical protein